MCGINAIIFTGNDPGETPIRNMQINTLHRGPDASHIKRIEFENSTIYLGVNRLRIVDQNPFSDQPFHENDNLLLFNGEIYNHIELKNELTGQGVKFKTSSDTEVLLYWISLQGKTSLHKIKGMFSFVFFNIRKGIMLAARDRHGMKPLYYYRNSKVLVISSEIRGILSSGLIKKDINISQINHFLNYRYPDSPETLYKDIMTVLPGSFMELNLMKNFLDQGVFKKDEKVLSPLESEDDIAEKTEELLVNSLIRHSKASVPVGLFLSGGVDSTLLLAMGTQHRIIGFHTFSIVNKKEDRNFGTEDFIFSKRAAKRYESYHDEFVIDHTLLNTFDAFVASLDQPVADSGAWLTWLLSHRARKTVGVVLSGAGADEYFGGYNRHMAFYRYLRNMTGIQYFLPYVKCIKYLLPTGYGIPFRKKLRLIKKFITGVEKLPEETYDNFIRLFNAQIPVEREFSWNEGDNKRKLLWNALNRDRKEYLVSDVLEISDRMSMQHSLEMRMPYLDDDLVDFVDSIESGKLLKHGPKWILKKLLNKYGGEQFIHRPKEGFGMPIGNWLRMPEYQTLWNNYLKPDRVVFNWVDPAIIINTFNQHIKKKADYSLEIWAFMVLSAWLEKEWS